MKARLFFVTILISISAANAQNYVKLVDDSAIWLVRHGNGEAWPTFYYYGFNGEDTILNSVTYHKVFRSSDTSFSANEYYGGMYEDTNAKQVFFFDHEIGQVRPLYDFSLNSGDSIDYVSGGWFSPFNITQCVVFNVDQTVIGGVSRTHVHLNQYFSSNEWMYGSWVEGIGNIATGGLIRSATALPTCDCADKLVCYRKDGNWIYHNPEFTNIDCDDPALAVADIVASTRQALVYPHPVTDVSVLKLNVEVTSLGIYDVSGRLIETYPAGTSQVNIRRADHAAGQYFFRAVDSKGNTTNGRFIIE